MTAAARVVAVIAGLAGLLFAAAGLVREIVLATHGGVAWPFAEWWAQLTTGPAWAPMVAAAAATVFGVALLVVAVDQLRPQRPATGVVEFGDAASHIRLDVTAMERALRGRLEKDLPGVKTRALELTQRGDGWWVRLEADVPARDLLGLQARAVGLLAAGLARTGGLRLDGADVVVTRLS